MSTRRVDDYAHRHGISNKEAKRRLGKGARSESTGVSAPWRKQGPIAGTGKPKGAAKG